MELPKFNLRPASELQKRRLARWLAEWELYTELESLDNPVAELSGSGKSNLDEPAPAAGQVRLVSPEIPAARNRLIYLAVLENASNAVFRTAVFSRFSEPCLPAEFHTRHPAPPLRVLCLWNSAVLPSHILESSWVVDELSADDLREALSICRILEKGDCIPVEWQERTGPPQWHPADPRLDYVRQESRALADILQYIPGKSIRYPESDNPLRRAAEDHTSYAPDSAP